MRTCSRTPSLVLSFLSPDSRFFPISLLYSPTSTPLVWGICPLPLLQSISHTPPRILSLECWYCATAVWVKLGKESPARWTFIVPLPAVPKHHATEPLGSLGQVWKSLAWKGKCGFQHPPWVVQQYNYYPWFYVLVTGFTHRFAC